MKNNKVLLAVFTMVLALTVSGSRAFAQTHPCQADAEKLCSGATGKVRGDCMKLHVKEVSAACKAKMDERQQKSEGDRPCSVYIQQYCKSTTNAKTLTACMKLHIKDVSAACKAKMAERKTKAGSVMPCTVYIQQYCKDAKDEAARKACMVKNKKEFSADCQAFMDKKASANSKGAKKKQ